MNILVYGAGVLEVSLQKPPPLRRQEYVTKAGIPSVFCSDMDAWQKTHVAVITNIANALYGIKCDNL